MVDQLAITEEVAFPNASQLITEDDTPVDNFELRGMHYTEMAEPWLEQVSLGLTTWEGEFEGRPDTWLRWRNAEGAILLTGDEQAEQERNRAEQAEQRADRLAELLRGQGIDPDQLSE